MANAAAEAIAFGADKVYVVDAALLKDYRTDAYVTVVEKVVKQANPRILLLGQTTIGRDLAPRAAARLATAAVLDCIALDIDAATKHLLMTKPVYGGNAQATAVSKSARPQMATIRPRTVPAAERNEGRAGTDQAVLVLRRLGGDEGEVQQQRMH